MSGFVSSFVKIVVFALVTGLLTGILAATIANANFGEMSSYTARFADASGLREGDDVRIRGVRVGQVESIEVAGDNIADVRFGVETDHELPGETTASVKYRNVIGQRYLSLGTDVDSAEPLERGDVIPVDRTQPALDLTELFNGFQPLFRALDPDEINKLSAEIISVFQGEGGTIDSLLAHTASVTSTIADRDEVIGEVVTNLNHVLDTINQRGPQTERLIDTTQALVTGLAERREPIGEATESLGDLTHSVAGLVSEARPPLREDIAALGELADTVHESKGTLGELLERLPVNMRKFTRVLSYGGWYNYFMCGISGTIGIESLNVEVPVIPLPGTQTAERCDG
ncbi:MCE family protein [Haloechinothrix sp. YIM 98757]|uniref:MCE family protein n=1 Tax=Haloechinothrix aidingensis TaxID=2752311 RepID=A0A838ACG7_9PSEU|nr:MCE family protein [Haloechinothrix aidingensis]MBA0126959.1 MCE family protein [Haloechinothrix aidingensis]